MKNEANDANDSKALNCAETNLAYYQAMIRTKY